MESWARVLVWPARTAESVVFAASVYLLIEPTRKALSFEGRLPLGPSFAGFVTVMVADCNLGRTVMHSWGCLLVCLPVSLVCALVRVALSAAHTREHAAAISLPSVFALVFSAQLLSLPDMGKKLGISLLALHLVDAPGVCEADVSGQHWAARPLLLFVHVMIGIGLALLGRLLPWPRLTVTELRP